MCSSAARPLAFAATPGLPAARRGLHIPTSECALQRRACGSRLAESTEDVELDAGASRAIAVAAADGWPESRRPAQSRPEAGTVLVQRMPRVQVEGVAPSELDDCDSWHK